MHLLSQGWARVSLFALYTCCAIISLHSISVGDGLSLFIGNIKMLAFLKGRVESFHITFVWSLNDCVPKVFYGISPSGILLSPFIHAKGKTTFPFMENFECSIQADKGFMSKLSRVNMKLCYRHVCTITSTRILSAVRVHMATANPFIFCDLDTLIRVL